ncbi:MAG TPA: Rho termination factor N-terminal domain-containing protein [Pyrinomonadaceae bacterium]|nr:Rho termination factor N-terminal domain-containing protein [Pyrinomonadaceae bacterium]
MPDSAVSNRDSQLAEIQRIEGINELLEKVLKASDVEVPDAELETEAPNTPDTRPDLSGMTKAELLEHAESEGIEVARSKTKAEIIEAIQGA